MIIYKKTAKIYHISQPFCIFFILFPFFSVSIYSAVFIGFDARDLLETSSEMALGTEPEIKSDLLYPIVRIFQKVLASPDLFLKDILLYRNIFTHAEH